MGEEIESLQDMKTWTLTKLPPRYHAISSKWVFKLKPAQGNILERCKACLVTRGFQQRQGVDYHETFALVAQYNTIKVIMTSLAGTIGWDIDHIDVKTACLNNHLKEKVYMHQPPGHIVKGQENLICELHQSLYSLKQSAQNWNRKINRWL